MRTHARTGGRARRLVLAVVVIVVLGAAAVIVLLERRFANLAADRLDLAPGTHLWAHRGTHGGFQGEHEPINRAGENSLPAFAASIRNGFSGIELDIHFLGDRGFVVKHDPPTAEDRLRLESVFAECGRNVYYWLDFKNLSDRNVDDVVAAFRTILERYPVTDRILIESANARPLAKLRDALPGAKAIYWVKRYPAGFANVLQRAGKRWKIAWFGFRNVSISHVWCTDSLLRDCSRLNLFLYTVNEIPKMAALRDAGVRVILTDRDTPPPGFQP